MNDQLLANLPTTLRNELFDSFNDIGRNFRESRWAAAELDGGKFCEIVYSIVRGYIDSSYPPSPTKPKNLLDACKALENASVHFPRSIRIQIPRMLIALYEIRNNRGVGHVGGDVDPNHMDAHIVLHMCKWVVAELIRVFHGVTAKEAEEAIEAIVDRTIPVVWNIGGLQRVLDPTMQMKDKTLVLLYSNSRPLNESELVRSLEHSNAAVYRRDILLRLHKLRFIEYDRANRVVTISPKGNKRVEEELLTQDP